jgi:hypothetical protein
VRIPRDKARPKLEDLQAWQEEIPSLPFQPDEEAILTKLIDNALEFRNLVSPFCNPVTTADECETQLFYLRKIEGAQILLVSERNFFRQELHKWSPVAPEPPPILDTSKSTHKPHPTKLQKLMAQHYADDPEGLPQSLRTKPGNFKRKLSEPSSSRLLPVTEPVDEEPYTIKCICDYQDDDGNTVYCQTCDTWQHFECYYPGRVVDASREEFDHSCADCKPRLLDREHAAQRERHQTQNKAVNDNGDRKTKRRRVIRRIKAL